jgi:hypothetical protein
MNQNTLHSKLINDCIKTGWKHIGFREQLRKRLSMRPWNEDIGDDCDLEGNEILAALAELRVLPDCWRVKIERWNWPVLVIEALEVCVTNDMSATKLQEYNNFWWTIDGTMRMHFRLFRMNRDGTTSVVLDKLPVELINAGSANTAEESVTFAQQPQCRHLSLVNMQS